MRLQIKDLQLHKVDNLYMNDGYGIQFNIIAPEIIT